MADDPTPDPAPTPDDPAPPADPPADPPEDDTSDEKLGEKGKAALDAERKARKEADKRARDAEARAKKLEDEKLSEEEKLKQRAEEGDKNLTRGTEKIRRANLLLSLTAKGITGGKAKAAARLLDGVEYDDDDEPTNLDSALEAAKAEYGAEAFTGATPPAPPAPDLHGGARPVSPQLDEDEGHRQVMAQFPQTAGSATN